MTSSYASGGLVVADGYIHATKRGMFVLVALCGARRIVHRTPKGFDPAHRLACPDCMARLETQPPPAG
jgi:hypothetical protein